MLDTVERRSNRLVLDSMTSPPASLIVYAISTSVTAAVVDGKKKLLLSLTVAGAPSLAGLVSELVEGTTRCRVALLSKRLNVVDSSSVATPRSTSTVIGRASGTYLLMAFNVSLRTSLTKRLLAFADVTVSLTGVVTALLGAQAPRTRKLPIKTTTRLRFMTFIVGPFAETCGKIATQPAYQARQPQQRATAPSTSREQTASSSTSPE